MCTHHYTLLCFQSIQTKVGIYWIRILVGYMQYLNVSIHGKIPFGVCVCRCHLRFHTLLWVSKSSQYNAISASLGFRVTFLGAWVRLKQLDFETQLKVAISSLLLQIVNNKAWDSKDLYFLVTLRIDTILICIWYASKQ